MSSDGMNGRWTIIKRPWNVPWILFVTSRVLSAALNLLRLIVSCSLSCCRFFSWNDLNMENVHMNVYNVAAYCMMTDWSCCVKRNRHYTSLLIFLFCSFILVDSSSCTKTQHEESAGNFLNDEHQLIRQVEVFVFVYLIPMLAWQLIYISRTLPVLWCHRSIQFD